MTQWSSKCLQYATQGDLTQFFPTLANLILNLDLFVKTPLDPGRVNISGLSALGVPGVPWLTSVSPISTRGGRLCLHWHPRIFRPFNCPEYVVVKFICKIPPLSLLRPILRSLFFAKKVFEFFFLSIGYLHANSKIST